MIRSGAPAGGSQPTDSYREFRHPLLTLVLATCTAGALDAFAFLRYGAFVANQSGNAIFLGIGPAGEHPAWPVSAASLLAFTASAGVVSWLRRPTRGAKAPLVDLAATEAAMIIWAVLNVALSYGRHGMGARVVLGAAGAVALGSLTPLLASTAGTSTRITYQSDTMTKTGEHAVRWIVGPRADRSRARTATLLGLLAIASYTTGGALGAFAQRQPLWVPLWGAIALAVLALLVRRDGRPAPARRAGAP